MLENVDELLERYLDNRVLEVAAQTITATLPAQCAVYDLAGKQLWSPNGVHALPERLDPASGWPGQLERVRAANEARRVPLPAGGEGFCMAIRILEGPIGYLLVRAAEDTSQGAQEEILAPVVHLAGTLIAEAITGKRTGADLAAELSERYEELSLVYTLTQAMDLSRDEDEAMDTIFRAVAETLAADLLILHVPVLAHLVVFPEEAQKGHGHKKLATLLYERMRSQKGPTAENYLAESTQYGDLAAPYSHVVCVPLDVDGDLGMLALLRESPEDRLYMGDVKMLEAVSKQVSIFLTNRKISSARKQLFDLTIFGLARLAESRDIETGAHLERTSSYCHFLARHLYAQGIYSDLLDEQFVETIFITSPLHDIGKVGIPDAILNKPGKLTVEEFELMKKHAEIGGDTLRDIEEHLNWGKSTFLTMGREIAYSHHEKWDGSGYPHGLGEQGIPLSARIMAVADVYDALTSKRCYKDAFTHTHARDIIVAGRGTHFDPALVEAFLKCEEAFVEVRRGLEERGVSIAGRLRYVRQMRP